MPALIVSCFFIYVCLDEPVVEESLLEEISATNPSTSAESSSSSETKFGTVTVQLQQGDLSKETTDAIVNTVGKDLALKGNK